MGKYDEFPGVDRMRDFLGKRVKLTRDLTTVGGEQFVAGETGVVQSHHRGTLTVSFPRKRMIRQLRLCDISIEASS